MRRGVLVLGLTLVIGAAAACGGEPTSKTPNAAGKQESGIDVRKARGLMYDGEKALKAEEFAQARDLLRQADRYANSTVRDEMRVVAERIDKAEATLLVADVVAAAQDGKCADGLDTAAELIRLPKKGPFFTGFVRELSAEANAACLVGMLEKGGTLREVRMLAGTTSAKQALGPKAFKGFEKKLGAAVGAALMKSVQEPLAQGKWAEVVTKLDDAVASGDAGQNDVKPVLDKVAAGLRAKVDKAIDEAMSQPLGAAAAVEQVDKLIAIAWSPAEGGAKPGASKLEALKLPPVPADLKQRRDALGFWAVCASVRCSESKPTKMWAYGHLPLTPTMEPKGKASAKIKHGTAVWQIATAAGVSLIARKDPGKLAGIGARARPAAGWVPANGLRSSNTSEWLPPGDALVGTRVWGPLRKGKRHYEVGTVVKIEGGQAKVRRMSDHQELKVALAQLRFGTLKKGQKVLAMCGGGFNLKPAVVKSVKETKFAAQGDPVVKVECLDDDGKPTGEERDEQMGSLRVEPGQLPPRR